MDCLLTYRDNYLCDDGGLSHIKSNEITDPHVLYNEILCVCGVKSTEKVPVMNAKSLRPDSYEWSRLGPMGYLVEPKLNPINICSMPVATVDNLIDIGKWQKKVNNKLFQNWNKVMYNINLIS